MARLSTSVRLGNTSTSSLIRSANSIQSEINSYNDSLSAYQYELSPKTGQDLTQYQDYLSKRIDQLNNTGSITDAQKSLTLTKTLTSAVRSNVTADIQRENIQIMAGNASLQDKYGTIVSQYQRAIGIGDLSLAQQLESQAYSVSQQIQYQAQQSAAAGEALAKAASSNAIYGQAGIVSGIDEALKQLNNNIKTAGGEKIAEATLKAWVETNRGALQAMGTVIPDGAQPNYFNVLEGLQHAKYNALILEAQLKAGTDPNGAQALAFKASNILTGATKISTLGGSLTIQEVQQAASDPMMFAYDYASGEYKRTSQTGFQYITDETTGQKILAPSYSGVVGDKERNKIYYLNANQTAQLTNLGLNFSANKNGTTGDGVQVQLTENTPDWLKQVLGNRGVTKAFTDKVGNLQFEGPSTSGQGLAYFTLVSQGNLHGVFEHSADGSFHLVGGNYGFDPGAASLLINAAQIKQQQIQLQTQAEQAAQLAQLKLATPTPLLQIRAPAPVAPKPVATAPLQNTITTKAIQPANYNPQPATYNPQPATQVTSNVQGVPLTQPKLNGIKL